MNTWTWWKYWPKCKSAFRRWGAREENQPSKLGKKLCWWFSTASAAARFALIGPFQLALIRRTPDVPVVDPPASKRGPTSLPEALTGFPLITSFVEEKRKSFWKFPPLTTSALFFDPLNFPLMFGTTAARPSPRLLTSPWVLSDGAELISTHAAAFRGGREDVYQSPPPPANKEAGEALSLVKATKTHCRWRWNLVSTSSSSVSLASGQKHGMEVTRRLRHQTVGNVSRKWDVNFKPNWVFSQFEKFEIILGDEVLLPARSAEPRRRRGELIAEHKGIDSLMWPLSLSPPAGNTASFRTIWIQILVFV